MRRKLRKEHYITTKKQFQTGEIINVVGGVIVHMGLQYHSMLD